jgi:hypothetical protein
MCHSRVHNKSESSRSIKVNKINELVRHLLDYMKTKERVMV